MSDREIVVGVLYCIEHEGIMNEDDTRCDFKDDDEPCLPQQCYIRIDDVTP